MPDLRESGHLEVRKTKGVGVGVVQPRGLAASLRSETSRSSYDVKSGQLNCLGSVGAWGTRRIGRESIMRLKPTSER
jgi:hypothetical protein